MENRDHLMISSKKKELESMDNKLEIELAADGGLVLLKKNERVSVVLKPCFPWTAPLQFFSLVDKEGSEVAHIKSLEELNSRSRQAVERSLEEASFCFVIQEIKSVDDEFELRRWRVNTLQGDRQFQTKLLDWPREVPGGGLLIQDVFGDLFFIPKPSELPQKSREMLMAFLD